MVEIIGTEGFDQLDGTAEDDVIDGLGFDDFLRGFGGSDSLLGGDGFDILTGAVSSGANFGVADDADDGADTLRGGDDSDLLRGVLGDDQLYGDAGDDTMRGGLGDDTMDGGEGFDFVSFFVQNGYTQNIVLDAGGFTPGVTFQMFDEYGDLDTLVGVERLGLNASAGDDWIRGSAYADLLTTGGLGRDTADAGGGDDDLNVNLGEVTATAGAGDDRIVLRSTNGTSPAIPLGVVNVVIDGGLGQDALTVDWYNLDRAFSLTVVGDIATLSAGAITATIRGVEALSVFGSALDDALSGGPGAESIDGANGADWVAGGGGDDTLAGGEGNDTLDGGEGVDRRRVFIFDYAPVIVDLRERVLNGVADEGEGLDTLSGFEGFVLTGGYNNDTLTGSIGDDVIDGGYGFDDIRSGRGSDLIGVSTWFDDYFGELTVTETGGLVDGGRGADTFSFAALRLDSVSGSFAPPLGIQVDLAAGTASFSSAPYVAGAEYVLTRVEHAVGSSQADRLTGSDRANRLEGGAGADTLAGGAGQDILIGGAGADSLDGGAGADRFVFGSVSDSPLGAPDIIFGLGRIDIIDLSAVDANANRRGDQTFILVEAFTSRAGQLVLEYGPNTAILKGDVTGDGEADLIVNLLLPAASFDNIVF